MTPAIRDDIFLTINNLFFYQIRLSLDDNTYNNVLYNNYNNPVNNCIILNRIKFCLFVYKYGEGWNGKRIARSSPKLHTEVNKTIKQIVTCK